MINTSFTQLTQLLLSTPRLSLSRLATMAKSKFEYVKNYELSDSLLPGCWIAVRVDGKAFHKFAEKHKFEKPNDARALALMSRAALGVLEEFCDVMLAYGQSDEYSFVFRRETSAHGRRASKLGSYVASLFTSHYVFHWARFFPAQPLLYPPCFDARAVLYPTDSSLRDYLSWRQADVHVNNLYNTAFWNLVQRADMTPQQAEQQLCGTVSSDKNELLFSRFNINYNNEPVAFRKGTTLLRKQVTDPKTSKKRRVVVEVCEDMIHDSFWQRHPELMGAPGAAAAAGDSAPLSLTHTQLSPFVTEQLTRKPTQNNTK